MSAATSPNSVSESSIGAWAIMVRFSTVKPQPHSAVRRSNQTVPAQ